MIPIPTDINAYLIFIRIAILFLLTYIPLNHFDRRILTSPYLSEWRKSLSALLTIIFSLLLAVHLETFVYDLF